MPNKGYKHSAEALAKISRSSKNRWQDPKYRKAVIKARLGGKRTEDTKAKMSAWQKGKKKKPLSEEHKKNIGKAMTSRVMSDEHKRKMSEAATGPNSSQWQGGVSFLPYSAKWTKSLKTEIRERDNNTCQLCSRTKAEEGRNLSVHHIDYNKKHCDETNLITLCFKCNIKVNTNREVWTKLFQSVMLVVV